MEMPLLPRHKTHVPWTGALDAHVATNPRIDLPKGSTRRAFGFVADFAHTARVLGVPRNYMSCCRGNSAVLTLLVAVRTIEDGIELTHLAEKPGRGNSTRSVRLSSQSPISPMSGGCSNGLRSLNHPWAMLRSTS